MADKKPIPCVNAYNGLKLHNNGLVHLCCMSYDFLTDRKGGHANVRHQTFDEIQFSPKAEEIRAALERGEQHPNCKRCWDEEAAGYRSKRIRDNERHNHFFEKNDKVIRMIELNLGNLCNLKCRICGPWNSSKWYKDWLKTHWHGTVEEFKQEFHQFQNSYDQSSLFWSEIRKALPDLEKIEIYGGEPFMVEDQWDVLRESVEKGYAKNQLIHMNTNATIYDQDKIDVLKGFGIVDINFSIDGTGDQFEYQRKGGKWDQVRENIRKFHEVGNPLGWHLVVCVTVNTFNIYYLPEILKYFEDEGVNFYINFVHDPKPYCISYIHPDVKKATKEKIMSAIENCSKDDFYFIRLREALGMLVQDEYKPEIWEEFKWKVDVLDKYRNESFDQTFPEFAALCRQTEPWQKAA